MSVEALWERVQMAWTMLSGRGKREVHAGRPREKPPAPLGDEPESRREGFVEEALPWLDAVYRFALRLHEGDQDAAEDLVQETFLRAHRFWDSFERGSNAKSWLFTICRNTFLHRKELIRNRKERHAADFDARVETLSAAGLERETTNPEREFFDHLIDDEVVAAIDALPEDFREVLVLSDLGDLTYQEITCWRDHGGLRRPGAQRPGRPLHPGPSVGPHERGRGVAPAAGGGLTLRAA